MDIKQLKYFLAIADEKQITAAAKKLHISQPPLSCQLRLLEEELGVQLVERGSRNIRLTGAGELLAARARQLLLLAESAKKEVHDYKNGMRGVLSIGTVSSSGAAVPDRAMLMFTKYYPDIRFEVHEGNTFAILDMLEAGVIDVGVVRTPFEKRNFCCRYAQWEPMIAVMTKENLCGHDDKTISLTELSEKPLICYRRFWTLISQTFADYNLTPFMCCKNDGAYTTVLWAKAGLGVGIIPKSAMAPTGAGELICKEIESEKLRTRLCAIWAGNRYLPTLGKRFIDAFAGEQNDVTEGAQQ